MKKRVFLDYASATPVDPRVWDAMLPYFSANFSNPSSPYYSGKVAREAVENARGQVAQSVGAEPNEVIFTSGGTEGNNIAILGVARALQNERKHILTCKTEHQSVLQPCYYLERQGWNLSYLPLDLDGVVDSDTKQVFFDEFSLCSVMLVNNEVGIIQPIAEISRKVKKKKALMHTDACQALGHIPINVNLLGVDLLTLNSGKIYGPKGAGALYIRQGTQLSSCTYGGKQELGIRPGTENVPAIVGFGVACSLAVLEMEEEHKRFKIFQNSLLSVLLKVPGVFLNSARKKSVPNIINISVADIEPEALVMFLNAAGIEVSSSSACTQSLGASHVLLALGHDQSRAQSSIRISLGRMTTQEEIDYVIQILLATVEKLRTLK